MQNAIKKSVTDTRAVCNEVFKKPKYLFLAIFVMLVLLLFNVMMVNYQLFTNASNVNLLFQVFIGTLALLPLHSLILLIIAVVLAGMFVALVVYHAKHVKDMNKSVATGSGGLILGILAPSCVSCGFGLVALLGFTGVLSTLPFDGLEISVIGIILLVWAITVLTKKMVNKTCPVHVKRKK